MLTLMLIAKAFWGNCQNTPLNYSPKELKEDYGILRKALETTYSSLYRFTDSLIMSQYLDDNLKSLAQPESETDFYKLITKTCAKVNDEHLIPTPSKAYYRSLENKHHYFPFCLKIIDRRFYVLKTVASGSAIPAGSEILSINGKTVEEMLDILLPTIPSDGYIQTFNTRHLEDYSMTEEENLFDLNYPIFIGDTTAYRLEYIDVADRSKKKIATVAGLDHGSYMKFFYGRNKLEAPLAFKYLEKNIAYLRISSFLKWHRTRFKQDFAVLYDSVFTTLKVRHTENLILDLRNNEGGDGTGEKLLTYLLTRPYQHFESTEVKFKGYAPVAEYLENGKDLFFADSLVGKTTNGLYSLKKADMPSLGEQPLNVNHYTGKLFVLINGASGSMAAVVAAFLKGNGRAIFIGEESGGTMEGNTSHQSARLVLPNTKIRVTIPLIKTSNAVAYTKGRGVEPDYQVTPKINDILIGIDTELNFARALISSKR
ncbi:peptidase S41-like protein [Mucilaginibacter gracilis]|uniref:Peptidase S41-like protein n=2 Tax=Mucilaginibacter TaxID=423349 RepID=A0A495IUL3_9SPHI|nr:MULTISPECIES: S41 family peptidase [Mucilaginibacter]RKR80446.1 peptidase S41-like protein [Mucilaginibacter gracilis]